MILPLMENTGPRPSIPLSSTTFALLPRAILNVLSDSCPQMFRILVGLSLPQAVARTLCLLYCIVCEAGYSINCPLHLIYQFSAAVPLTRSSLPTMLYSFGEDGPPWSSPTSRLRTRFVSSPCVRTDEGCCTTMAIMLHVFGVCTFCREHHEAELVDVIIYACLRSSGSEMAPPAGCIFSMTTVAAMSALIFAWNPNCCGSSSALRRAWSCRGPSRKQFLTIATRRSGL